MYSKIFMPGDKPELLEQMVATGAHWICLDLEDTVTPTRKTMARESVCTLLAAMNPVQRARVIVRVNGLDSGMIDADLRTAISAGNVLINVPKLESVDEVHELDRLLTDIEKDIGQQSPTRLLLNVESPKGLRNAYAIASASPRATGLQIGYADLLEPYGIARKNPDFIGHVQASVRLAAIEAGIEAYDGVFADLTDDEFFAQECMAARRLNFAGKSCFNASQVAIVNHIFAPTAEEIQKAQRIVDAAATQFAQGVGLFELDGRIVDQPFVMGAQQLLKRARDFEALQAQS